MSDGQHLSPHLGKPQEKEFALKDPTTKRGERGGGD